MKYYVSIGQYGADLVYDVVSEEAFRFWSKKGPEAIKNYIFDNQFEEECPDVAPALRLPRWHGDDGQRVSGCGFDPETTVTATDADGVEVWSSNIKCLDRDDLVGAYEEVYPAAGEHAVLAWVAYKSDTLITAEIESDRPFDPALLKVNVVDLWGNEIIRNVIYDGVEIPSDGDGRAKTDGEVILR